MGKEKKEHLASYRPIPNKARFWLHSEYGYTEQELNFRDWVLAIRSKSGIHPDYLTNQGSWFADSDQALVNIYEHAWLYSDSFKPRQVLTRDDFHVQPIDSQRLQWPSLYDLMQNVGDYLLLRNQELPEEHLNQPMNYVLLDVNNILKGLSQNTNIQQVQEQLELLTHYLRTIEKNISPLEGSDRLFLANFRSVIDNKIHPHLTHLVESQLLRERLGELSKTIKKLSTDRNRILHFALNISPVNPHPYDFTLGHITDSSAYPTQVAKNCGKHATELVADSAPVLHLTMEQLKNCPKFHLIAMDEDILNHYANAVSDLDELDRFQKVVAQIMDLLGQAGEVYTIHQFKEQMLSLLNQIDVFIDESSHHIDAIIDKNTQAYHKAIQQEQDLSVWKRLFTAEQAKLQTFRKNHDTLSQFPSSSSDLLKTNKALKGQVNQVITHLSASQIKDTSFEAIAGQAQELDKLMGSMHHWVKHQHTKQGRIGPSAPEPLTRVLHTAKPQRNSITAHTPAPHYSSLFPPTSSTLTEPICQTHPNECPERYTPPDPSTNSMFYLGLITLIPVTIIVLIFIYEWKKGEQSAPPAQGTKKDFKHIKLQIDDVLTKIKEHEHVNNTDLTDEYDIYIDQYKELIGKAQLGTYYCDSLAELLEDLNQFYQELVQSPDELDTGSKCPSI
ncbi:hypothetical protein ELY21_07140 [Legionella sp. km535]|uniref:hypothetical protein n=1 Tax=Legionella sp. km535 TaxID=2498107 RepID=UPI000F8E11AF|nr:hypothetical protein [Legionella sp. km535]RUR18715.1 hypothetical protein ELY21_07140 [Legionella sp. km535]